MIDQCSVWKMIDPFWSGLRPGQETAFVSQTVDFYQVVKKNSASQLILNCVAFKRGWLGWDCGVLCFGGAALTWPANSRRWCW